ncbi:MAG: hypothetical protein QM811_11120 [Pirellulales bacterium]
MFVIEFGLILNLAHEAADRLRRRFTARQDFDRHQPAQHVVLGQKDLAHAPLAQRVDDHVRPEMELAVTGQQLIGLKAREVFALDQRVGESRIGDFRFSGR